MTLALSPFILLTMEDVYIKTFKAMALIVLGSTALVLLIVWLSQKLTHGRGILYKFVHDYGYDDARTLDALLNVMTTILTLNEGMTDDGDLTLYHEVGNRYTGEYWEDEDTRHDIVVRTDGWRIEYWIDNHRPKSGKVKH